MTSYFHKWENKTQTHTIIMCSQNILILYCKPMWCDDVIANYVIFFHCRLLNSSHLSLLSPIISFPPPLLLLSFPSLFSSPFHLSSPPFLSFTSPSRPLFFPFPSLFSLSRIFSPFLHLFISLLLAVSHLLAFSLLPYSVCLLSLLPQRFSSTSSTIKTAFGLKCNLRLQYTDQDFGNNFFNLNSTTELKNLGTIKVIHQQTNPPLIIDPQSTLSLSISFESDDGASLASNDTIPQFSYDTELQLERGNTEYCVSQKMLTVSSRKLSDILKRVAEEIYCYKAYPEDTHFCAAAEALIKKHPCLKEPGSFNGCYGWKRLKYKMSNYRLKLQGCPELCVNSLKSKATTDAFPAKKVKKPKCSEATFIHPFLLVRLWIAWKK